MKRFWLLLPVLALAYIVTLNLAASDNPPKSRNFLGADKDLMSLKLSATQKTLEGLVAKDFLLIQKAGEELRRLDESKMWSDVENPEYTHYRNELNRQAKKLIELAEARNLDGAAFAYTSMVGTCINCHTHCRDVLKIATFGPDSKVFPIPTNDMDDPISSRPGTIRR